MRNRQRTPDHRLEAPVEPPPDPVGDKLNDEADNAINAIEHVCKKVGTQADVYVEIDVDELVGTVTLTVENIRGTNSQAIINDYRAALDRIVTDLEEFRWAKPERQSRR